MNGGTLDKVVKEFKDANCHIGTRGTESDCKLLQEKIDAFGRGQR